MPLAPSKNYFLDNDDLRWHLEHSVDWDELVEWAENGFTLEDGPESVAEAKELYLAILEEAGRFVANEVAPRAEALDAEGSKLVKGEVKVPKALLEIDRGLKAMDLHGLCVPREAGGMNAPALLQFVLSEVMGRADCGVMARYSFHGGIAIALLGYAAKEGSLSWDGKRFVLKRFEKEIRELAAGDACGAMVLTEPGAGSDLGAIRTKAILGSDGVYRLSGEKIFITEGQGQYHIVLARTGEGGALGLEGLSLFLVPRIIARDGKEIANFQVTKVEDKIGHHSSVTASVLYEESEGELIGALGQGFELMLFLMNNARVAVGFEAVGVCEAAYRMAMHYANERRTMGRRLAEHELIAERLQAMDTDIRGLRALGFEAAKVSEIAQRIELKLQVQPPEDEEEQKRLKRRLKRLKRYARELTPLFKYLAAEKAVEITRQNMQIHGGMGYMRETGAERLLRDALVLPVYEGTSEIQALMALKDHLGFALKDPAAFVAGAARARLQAQVARGPERTLAQAEALLYRSLETVIARVVARKVKAEWGNGLFQGTVFDRLRYLRTRFLREWDPKADFKDALVHAERLTRILCDVTIARILLKQGREHPERLIFAERHLKAMLPRVTALHMEIAEVTDLDELREVAKKAESLADVGA